MRVQFLMLYHLLAWLVEELQRFQILCNFRNQKFKKKPLALQTFSSGIVNLLMYRINSVALPSIFKFFPNICKWFKIYLKTWEKIKTGFRRSKFKTGGLWWDNKWDKRPESSFVLVNYWVLFSTLIFSISRRANPNRAQHSPSNA